MDMDRLPSFHPPPEATGASRRSQGSCPITFQGAWGVGLKLWLLASSTFCEDKIIAESGSVLNQMGKAGAARTRGKVSFSTVNRFLVAGC